MARHTNPAERTAAGELYLGSKIRELREKKGWSVKELAEQLGRHPAALSKIETNAAKPSQRVVSKLAELLGVPISHLQQSPLHPRILAPGLAAEPESSDPLRIQPQSQQPPGTVGRSPSLRNSGDTGDTELASRRPHLRPGSGFSIGMGPRPIPADRRIRESRLRDIRQRVSELEDEVRAVGQLLDALLEQEEQSQ